MFTFFPQEAKKMIHDDITRLGKENGLHSFEQVPTAPPEEAQLLGLLGSMWGGHMYIGVSCGTVQ